MTDPDTSAKPRGEAPAEEPSEPAFRRGVDAALQDIPDGTASDPDPVPGAPAGAGSVPAGEGDLSWEPEAEPEAVPVSVLLLDMGGVLLDLGEARGLPWGELERRGREELLGRIREAGGEAEEDDLDRWLFDPWRRGYARRRRVGREERWGPHLARLQRRSGTSGVTRGGLLEAWARPYLDALRPISGAEEALGRLVAADVRMALVSNVPLPGVFYRRVLEREGLAAFFEGLFFSYDQGTRKPAPLLLHRALRRLGVDWEEWELAVMVGDRRSTDVGAGWAAGVRTVWIECADRDGPEPDAAIGSIAELPELIGL